MSESKRSVSTQKKSLSSTPKRLRTDKVMIEKGNISIKYDQSYKFHEVKVVKAEEELAFHGKHFLRAHSKKNDPADVQTQIWQCSFEPDPRDPSQFTDIVATCGGSSVCFIDVKTGEVKMKYNRSIKGSATENLYALVWSSLPLDVLGMKRMNILATSGGRSTVILIHPEGGCCYEIFRTVPRNNVVVCSLLFHPKKASWLFCGHDDGHIQLWDVGIPSLPDYKVVTTHLLKIPPFGADVYNMVYSQENDLLLAGCDGGLFAWKFDLEKIEKGQRFESLEFHFDVPATEEHGSVVDSICLVRDNILAVKCALHGLIYLINIRDVVGDVECQESTGRGVVELTSDSLLQLKWSDTDNYYMNMGCDSKSGTLVCGDDKGALWVYDLATIVKEGKESPLFGGLAPSAPIEPDIILEWPDINDTEVEKARKVRLDAYDIVVDKCNVSFGAEYIVAVTSNNVVCIWKRGTEEEENKEDKGKKK